MILSLYAAVAATGRRRVLAAILLSVAIAGLEGAGLLMLAPLLAEAGVGKGDTGLLSGLLLRWGLPAALSAWVGVVALHGVTGVWRDRLVLDIQQSLVDSRRRALFSAAAAMEWRAYTQERSADLTNMVTVSLGRVRVGVGALLQGLARTLLLLAHAAVALLVSPKVGGLALLAGLLLALMRLPALRRARHRGSSVEARSRSLHNFVQEHLAVMKLAKASGMASIAAADFADELAGEAALNVGLRSAQARESFYSRILASIAVAVGVWIAVDRLGLSGAPLLVLGAVFARFLPAAGDLMRMAAQVAEVLPAWDESGTMLARFTAAGEVLEEPDEDRPPRGDLVLRDLSFTWAGRQDGLSGADAVIEAGRITALIGPSGAGKTTLADLALGLLEPDGGTVSIGGRPLIGSLRTVWRHHCAYVTQETFLFNASVADNLRWGRPHAESAQLWDALRAAQADELVRRLPQGLDTLLGDRGLRLSGGERQRLALARALLRQPVFLVLDEATSALDTESEAKILHALEGLRGRLTMLIIAHRLSTVRIADRVLALEKGRLQDRGRPV